MREWMKEWSRMDWAIAVFFLFIVALLSFTVYAAITSSDEKREAFMKACQKIGKSKDQCEYEWLLRPDEPIVVPVYTGR